MDKLLAYLPHTKLCRASSYLSFQTQLRSHLPREIQPDLSLPVQDASLQCVLVACSFPTLTSPMLFCNRL